MGSDATNTVFRISLPLVSASQPVEVELDQTYYPNNPANALMPTGLSTYDGATEYRFTVPTALVSRYQNMVVRVGKGEPAVIAIPQEEKKPAKPALDPTVSPPCIKKGTRGPIEFQGTSLDDIKAIMYTSAGTSPAVGNPVPQEFDAYSGGKRLTVYVTNEVTALEGKVVLDCSSASGDALKLTIFVVAA